MTAHAYAPRGTPSTTRVPLLVYGRRWCGISQMIRRYLDRLGVPYEYVDMDQNPSVERQLSWLTGGRARQTREDREQQRARDQRGSTEPSAVAPATDGRAAGRVP